MLSLLSYRSAYEQVATYAANLKRWKWRESEMCFHFKEVKISYIEGEKGTFLCLYGEAFLHVESEARKR
ncbi:hypothetical protein P3S67_004563 [Capsicum chacoense]